MQSHYELSNEFFALWRDSNQVDSGAYFERDDMTLDEAQLAEVGLSLGKLGLQPGMMRAIETYDVNVIGLTLSHNQRTHIEQLFAGSRSPRRMEGRLVAWEEFDEPVDRIVSIGAFEHFGFAKYHDFFQKTYSLMPDDGVMLLPGIVALSTDEYRERQLQITTSRLRFVKFIVDEIFPGGRLPLVTQVEEQATSAGFQVTRVQRLRFALHPHTRYLGGQPRTQARPGGRGHLKRGLRQVLALPDRLRRSVPQGLYRCLPVHLRKG